MIGPLLTQLFFFCTSCCCLGNVGPVAVDDTLTISKSGSLVVKLGQLSEIHSDLSDADWGQSLSLRLAQPADAPAILGKRRFHPATKEIEFIPRFPLVGGSKIRVEISIADHPKPIWNQVIRVPMKNAERSKISVVYPTSNRLPENLLKFYVHFSGPMQTGNIYEYLSIIDDSSNSKIRLPFLELEQELWSRDRTRVTLLFDPGRIKRELKPRLDLGPVIEAGKKYRLEISGSWPDIHGFPLGVDFIKRFDVLPPEKSVIHLQRWKVKTPKKGSRDEVVIDFDKPLDAALARRVIGIYRGEILQHPRSIELTRHETRWTWHPKQDWAAGDYRIQVAAELEDLCGNRVDRVFDFDLSKKQILAQPVMAIPFQVR